jgi:hypothetical protein
MKVWQAKLAFCLLMLFISPCLKGEEAKGGKAEQANREEWSYQLQIREKGTRSEGRVGILMRDGSAVIGKAEGEILETPFGKFRWFGNSIPEDPVFRDRGWLNQWSGGKKTVEGR